MMVLLLLSVLVIGCSEWFSKTQRERQFDRWKDC